jgi:hypothetical protein
VTRKRKWVLRAGLVALVAVAAGGTWVAMNRTELKAMYAARQLRNAAGEEERAAAADRLASLGNPGLKRLVEFLCGGDAPCRSAAAAAFGRLLDGMPEGEQWAVIVGGQLLDAFPRCDAEGQRAILELLPCVLNKTGNAHGERCRAAVAAGLAMPDPAARVCAVRIAMHPDVRMRADLVPLLGDANPEVRRAALFAVAAPAGEQLLGDEELFRFLHDPDEGVRKVCRDALVSRDRTETEIALGGRLTHPDPVERLKLLMDLRYDDDVADPEPWLERLSRDPEPAVRAGAARVAIEVTVGRQMSSPRWVARVADADENPTVRRVVRFFQGQAAARSDPGLRPASGP